MTHPEFTAPGMAARSPIRHGPLVRSPAGHRQSSAGLFGGLKVLSLEARRAGEVAALIGDLGGVPMIVPSMREQKPSLNGVLDTFERLLRAGDLHALVCATGLGTRSFLRELTARDSRHLDALRQLALVGCGPQALRALTELGLCGANVARLPASPLPWDGVRDHLLNTLAGGQHAALLEYGEAMPGPVQRELAFGGVRVTHLPVYRCAFPLDTGPLDRAVRDCVLGGPDVLLLSSGMQALHFLKYAEGLGLLSHTREALGRLVTVSIGPACSEAAADLGVRIDLEASPHKLGDLVRLAAERAPALIEGRRRAG